MTIPLLRQAVTGVRTDFFRMRMWIEDQQFPGTLWDSLPTRGDSHQPQGVHKHGILDLSLRGTAIVGLPRPQPVKHTRT